MRPSALITLRVCAHKGLPDAATPRRGGAQSAGFPTRQSATYWLDAAKFTLIRGPARLCCLGTQWRQSL